MPRGLRQRATSGRDLLSLDSTSPSCQEGSRPAKEHKASVSSGLLGIFSAKSPISPEQNPEIAGQEKVEVRAAAAQLLPLGAQ